MNLFKDTLQLHFLGKTYTVSCPANESTRLKEAAQYLEQKVNTLYRTHRQAPTERVAIVAALDMAVELLTQQAESLDYRDTLDAKVRALTATLSTALDPA